MGGALSSIIRAGTKLWLDSVDPDLVAANRAWGATGATSNPIIISELIQSGRYDRLLTELMNSGLSDNQVAWSITDQIVSDAQAVFRPVWDQTRGDDGYVSFEVDPLLEDPDNSLSQADRVERYVELGTEWSLDQPNRLIKVPATAAGIAALEELAAQGVPLNVTLIFSMRQYVAARDAVWRGAQRHETLNRFKSVYSIFISRVDVYAEQHAPSLSPAAQGQVGLANAKEIWRANQAFWAELQTPLKQEIVFASTGAKRPGDAPWKYVEALVGSDIQTNPPGVNAAIDASGREFGRTVDDLLPHDVVAEIDANVDYEHLERTLMDEGIRKFADPQKSLLALIAQKRAALATGK